MKTDSSPEAGGFVKQAQTLCIWMSQNSTYPSAGCDYTHL